jgi:hypothetical protein
MKTAEITIYKFNELSESAKETARNWWKESMDIEFEQITESIQLKLEELGLPTEDVQWRLSCCQGDGVAFYGSLDVEEYLVKNKIKSKFRKLFDADKDLLIDNVEIYSNNSHYNHYNTMSISYNEALYNGYENSSREQALEDFTDHLQEHIKDLSRDFEKAGYEDVESITSNECVDESLVANEYDFTEDGEVFTG